MARRVAFLIGNQNFRDDSGLTPLEGPSNDIAALARLLRDPGRGNFAVYEFLDKPSYEITPEIARALDKAMVGDLFLIYYSGHGKLDRSGRLCLATAETCQGAALLATSIQARQLRDFVEESNCNQVVLLLDCCFSGAVEDGLRGDVDSELHIVEEARGFYIMTASTGIQAARETASVSGGVVMGHFTAALVNGIETGAADQERKGRILVSDLRHYLEQRVTSSTPQFFARKASGDPLISLSPATARPLLDAGLLADLNAEQWHRRSGAVFALSKLLRTGDAATRAAARTALQGGLEQERDYAVRERLLSALSPDRSIGAPSEVVPQAVTPKAPASAKLGRSNPETEGKPSWADDWGRDAHGPRASFSVIGQDGTRVVQRLRWIPPGRFLMGSPETEKGRYNFEGPRHEVVFVDGFWLFETACTEALWEAVMGRPPEPRRGARFPVTNVSWDDAQKFIRTLNTRLPGIALALPSEAQWEYACRAGTQTPYSFGTTITKKQVCYDSSGPVEVGSLPANGWGLHEMHGNVWEWCADHRHDSYEGAPTDGSAWIDTGKSAARRVIRGGSWRSDARNARAAYRYHYDPAPRNHNLGFRCARVQSDSVVSRVERRAGRSKRSERSEPAATSGPQRRR